jgi:ribosomal protein L37AE/L43A
MALLEELNALLDRMPLWKRLSALPQKTDELEARIAALEAQLSGKAGPTCPVCNAPGFKRAGSKPDPAMGGLGFIQDSYVCEACGHSENRMRDAMTG